MKRILMRYGGLIAVLLLAVVVAAPGVLRAYTTLGGSLGTATTGNGWQRDVRMVNNSNDAAANNNNTPDPSYPGALGAPLAIWKAARAWASDNPLAGQNFEFDWQGVMAADDGNGNTITWDAGACSGGVLAYCEVPISDGWSIVMCDNWTWADGPGNPGSGQYDIQGIAAHELGHALGLGHSSTGCGASTQPTMCPSVFGSGTAIRTIEADDQAGLGQIYGTIPANKPLITSLSGSLTTLQTLVINGTSFPATVNVKFTAKTSLDVGTISGVVYGVPSSGSGTQVSVTIPQAADDGNVIVWDPATGLISNAFPIDVAYVPPPPPPVPTLASVSPSTVNAFAGGLVTLTGTGFTGATQVQVGASALGAPFGFSVVSDTTIAFQSPIAAALGPAPVTVTTPGGTSNAVQLTFVETLPPVLAASPLAVGGVSFNWSFGAGANDVVYVIASTDPTTFVFGTDSFLLNYTIIGQVVVNAAGVGGFSTVVPTGLAGVVFHSQAAAVDDVTFAVRGSNVKTTTILN
jgi:hypothetical protein